MMTNKDLSGIKNSFKIAVSTASVLLVVMLFVGCVSSETADSKDVNQKKIHQSYSVVYDASGDDSYAVWAQFRFGGDKGTTLQLSEPSTVSVNGVVMDENHSDFYGCSYDTRVSGTNKFTFKFIDTEKTEYVNSITVIPVKPTEVKLVNADKDVNLYWTGEKLGKDESMTAFIEDNEGNRAEGATDIIGADYIVLNVEDMQYLVNGNGQIYFTRSKSVSTQQAADEGGYIYCEYNSEKTPVKILKKKVTQTVNQ